MPGSCMSQAFFVDTFFKNLNLHVDKLNIPVENVDKWDNFCGYCGKVQIIL
jgi:hypothetical protein